MHDDAYPVEWAGGQAVVQLPEHVGAGNAGQLRDRLLAVINRGAAAVVLDMTGTVSCDHAGLDAIARAYQRAAANGIQLRLVVSEPVVRRTISIEGIDRIVAIFPTVAGALAAGTPSASAAAILTGAVKANGSRPTALAAEAAVSAITPAVLWHLIDALGDGLALSREDGEIVLANSRCAEMFGYQRDQLIGRRVESLVPPDLRAAHEDYRAAYARAPALRPMGERARLVGMRSDGATIPVEISLSPVPTATGHFILTVIRDATQAGRRQDLADIARAAVADQTRRSRELLDRIVRDLFQVGLSLQESADLPGDLARDRIAEAVAQLDEAIREIRSYQLDSLRDE